MSKSSKLFGKFKRDETSGNQPDNGTPSRHFFAPTPTQRSERAVSESPSFMAVASDVSAPLENEMFEHGRQVALERGDPNGNDEDRHHLKEHAIASAEATNTLPYNPKNNPIDAANERDVVRLENERDELRPELRNAINEKEQVERDRANNCVHPDRPSNPGCALFVAALFIALTLAAAIHEGPLQMIDDDWLAWLISIIASLIIGGGICYLLLWEYKNTAHSSKPIWVVAVGITFCLSLAIIRLVSIGFSTKGMLLALALFLLEAAAIIAVEIIASGLRARYINCSIHDEEDRRFGELLKAATNKVERIDKSLAEVEHEIEKRANHRSERISRAGAVPALKKLLVQSALAGYAKGLAELAGQYRPRRYHSRWVAVGNQPMQKKE